MLFAAAGGAEIIHGLFVDREEAHGRAVFGRHVRDRRAIHDRQRCAPGAEKLDELSDDLALRSNCVMCSARSVAVTPSRNAPVRCTPTTSGVRK